MRRRGLLRCNVLWCRWNHISQKMWRYSTRLTNMEESWGQRKRGSVCRRRGHILINLWMKLCWRACHVGAVLWRCSWRLTTGNSLVSVLCGYMEVGIYRDERCSFGMKLQLLQEHLNPGWAFTNEWKMGKAFRLNAFNWCNWVSKYEIHSLGTCCEALFKEITKKLKYKREKRKRKELLKSFLSNSA